MSPRSLDLAVWSLGSLKTRKRKEYSFGFLYILHFFPKYRLLCVPSVTKANMLAIKILRRTQQKRKAETPLQSAAETLL